MSDPRTPDHAAPRPRLLTLKRRRYLYGVIMALVPVAVLYGIVTAEAAAALLMLAAAVLGIGGVALANPTKQ